MKYFTTALIALAWLAISPQVEGAVVDSTRQGFTVKIEQTLPYGSVYIYDSFCKEIDKWWDPDHTWSGKSENLYLQPYIGGIFGERWETGASIRHMNVIYTDPGKFLRLEGGLGPLQQFAVTGIMTLELKEYGEETRVTLTYTAGGYVPGGVSAFAPAVDQVLAGQMKRFSEYLKNKK